MNRVRERLAGEPALVAAVLVAVANLVAGQELALDANLVESGVVIVTGWLVRRRVSPVQPG